MCSMIEDMDTTPRMSRVVPTSAPGTYIACDFPDEDEDYGQVDEVPSVDINDL